MDKTLKHIKLDKEKVGFFRYRQFGDKYLITNDFGRYVFIGSAEFKQLLEGKLNKKSKLYFQLQKEGFLKDGLNIEKFIEIYKQKNNFLFQGPSLHIIVVTLRCNYNCVYCQASSRRFNEKGFDMNRKTAKAVVDAIFESPSKNIAIEFQGGEPLANWPITKFIIEYARQKNKKMPKKLFITVVTNLSLMNQEQCNYLTKNHISVCTSLDGPEKLHNFNRPLLGGNSYKATTSWIKKFKDMEDKDASLYKINALLTVSRQSLKQSEEIIKEYLKWGFTGIHLRPLSNLGLSGKFHQTIGYSTNEFLEFWRKSMDYILNLNLKGKLFYERGSLLMLKKILTDSDPNFLDLRSPCGAGIGQMLYNYDGKIYTCDEARMLGEDAFALGNVNKNTYQELMSHPNLRAVCQASILENTACDYCVYKPHCGICPVLNYALYGNLFAPNVNNYRCQLHTGIFDYLFQKLENKKYFDIFKKWIGVKLIRG